jgi:ferredoxin-NADP reductase
MSREGTTDMQQNNAFINRLQSNETSHAVVSAGPSPKQKITFSLPTPLIERLRNAVYWTGDRSLASLVEEALVALVTEMEEINQEAFPQRLSPLKAGRRQGKRVSAVAAPYSLENQGCDGQ